MIWIPVEMNYYFALAIDLEQEKVVFVRVTHFFYQWFQKLYLSHTLDSSLLSFQYEESQIFYISCSPHFHSSYISSCNFVQP